MKIWSMGVLEPFWVAGGAKDGPRVSKGGPKGDLGAEKVVQRLVYLKVFGAGAKATTRSIPHDAKKRK